MAGKRATEFMIVNRRSKKALQAAGVDNGSPVEQAAPNGSDAQLWSIVKIKSSGSVKLKNKLSGKILDVVAEGVDNGVRAQVWDDVNGMSQQWELQKLTATYSKLLNVRSGRVLDIADMSSDDGAPAQIWDDVDGVGQQWKLVPAAPTSKTVKKAGKASGRKPAAKTEKAAPAKRGRPPKAAAQAETKPEEKAPVKPVPKKNAAKPAAKTTAKKPRAKKAETKKPEPKQAVETVKAPISEPKKETKPAPKAEERKGNGKK